MLDLDRDIGDSDAGANEQLASTLDATTSHVLVRRQAGGTSELPREMERTQRRHPREVGQ